MAWFFSSLTQGLGLGMGGVGLVGAGLAVLWGIVGFLLGRNFSNRSIT